MKKLTQTAFTIIELLIVIVVIGILATLVLNVVQDSLAKGRDATRRSHMNQILKALEAYAVDNETYLVTGAGHLDAGQGWINLESTTHGYNKAISEALNEAGYGTKGAIAPFANANDQGIVTTFNQDFIDDDYMAYRCLVSGSNYEIGVMGTLELPTTEESQTVTDWVSDGCINFPIVSYGKNFVIRSSGRNPGN